MGVRNPLLLAALLVTASCGTAPPHAITTGTNGMVILSPTPPVECLSTNASGFSLRRRSVKSSRSPELTARGQGTSPGAAAGRRRAGAVARR